MLPVDGSTTTPVGEPRFADPNVERSAPVEPFRIWIRLFLVSATYTRPSEPTATPAGWLYDSLSPPAPFPCCHRNTPSAENFLIRLFCVSAMTIDPSLGSVATAPG